VILNKTRTPLLILILIVFIFQIIKFYSYYIEQSSWQYADWLINYQGGFVRRGLIGEIFFIFYKILFINLDILIFTFVIFLYAVFSYFLVKSIKYIENSKINILIFLSPGLFIYPIMNSEIIGRKDILLLAIISSFVYLDKKINQKFHFPILIFAIVLLSLSHSGFLFYSPYLIFLFILIKYQAGLKLNLSEIVITTISLILLALFINSLNGTELQIKKICESIKEFVGSNCETSGQIYHLSSGVEYRFAEKFKMGEGYIRDYLIIYIISLIFTYLFISTKFINSKFNKNILNLKKANPFAIIFILFIMTIPVYIFGRDWGRYIYISYSCTFFIYIYCLKNNIIFFKNIAIFDYFKNRKILFIIFIFFYSFFWTFPFYDANDFKLTLKKPLISILEKIN